MVYRAFMRATEGAFRWVGVSSYSINYGGEDGPFGENVALLPRWVGDHINDFDNEQPVTPFSFDLELDIPA